MAHAEEPKQMEDGQDVLTVDRLIDVYAHPSNLCLCRDRYMERIDLNFKVVHPPHLYILKCLPQNFFVILTVGQNPARTSVNTQVKPPKQTKTSLGVTFPRLRVPCAKRCGKMRWTSSAVFTAKSVGPG